MSALKECYMKNIQILLLAYASLLLSCSSQQEQQTKKITSFITGTYVREFEGEYSIGHDTLVITQPDAANQFYLIQHNSSYQKIIEKKLQPVAYKSENWTAILNEETNILTEQKKGKQMSFSPDANELLLGGSHFHKINNNNK